VIPPSKISGAVVRQLEGDIGGDAAGPAATQAISVQPVEMEGNSLAVGGNLAGGVTITVSAADTSASGNNLSVTIGKNSYGPYKVTDHIFIYGQGGSDKITLAPYVVGNNTYYYIQVPAFIYAEGSGKDKISASGSQANNVLVGHGSNELLTGGSGRDLLIAGTGTATLNAGNADDILIGGWTSYDLYNAAGYNAATTYDQKLTALEAIMAEWGSPDSPATRISYLTYGGGRNGSFVLTGSSSTSPTVHAGGADTLVGAPKQSSALDWFFASAVDTLTNYFSATETKTTIS
jgi:Ca2+-binding RTX toxin-like protein